MSKELKNYTFCDETIKLKQNIENSFIEMGRRLMTIRDNRLFEPQWTSFAEYLEEMKLSEAQASKLINIVRKIVIRHQFSTAELLQTGGWAVLAEILPFITDKTTRDEVQEMIDDSKVLTMQDLRKKLKEKKTGIDMSQCKHDNFYILKICRTCKDKFIIPDEYHTDEIKKYN